MRVNLYCISLCVYILVLITAQLTDVSLVKLSPVVHLAVHKSIVPYLSALICRNLCPKPKVMLVCRNTYQINIIEQKFYSILVLISQYGTYVLVQYELLLRQ